MRGLVGAIAVVVLIAAPANAQTTIDVRGSFGFEPGIVALGEEVVGPLALTNDGAETLTNVTAELQPDDGLVITAGSASFGPIASGQTVTGNEEFRFTIDLSLALQPGTECFAAFDVDPDSLDAGGGEDGSVIPVPTVPGASDVATNGSGTLTWLISSDQGETTVDQTYAIACVLAVSLAAGGPQEFPGRLAKTGGPIVPLALWGATLIAAGVPLRARGRSRR